MKKIRMLFSDLLCFRIKKIAGLIIMKDTVKKLEEKKWDPNRKNNLIAKITKNKLTDIF